jgi:Uma2 family endonuclease
MATRTLLTAEQLAGLSGEDDRYKLAELDEGELIEGAAASARHGCVGVRLAALLYAFVHDRSLGTLYGTEAGFVLTRNPDTVVCPDLAFVRSERVPEGDTDEFFPGAPDLAVEIFSKTYTFPRLMRIVRQYFRYGTHTVWILYPAKTQVQVLEFSGKNRLLSSEAVLESPELLPGFSIPIKEVFGL